MRKTLLSDRGNTLVLVLGLAMVIALLVVPLATMLGTSHRQAVANAQYEKAHEQAEGVALVFQKLLLADQDDLIETPHIHEWATKLQAMNLCTDSTVVYDELNREVTVSCTEGSGSVARTAPVKFQLNFNPASVGGGGGGGPGSVSDGTEFYHEYLVVSRNPSIFDKTFCTREETGATVRLPANDISHDYNQARYQEEFNRLVDYYLGSNFDARLHASDRPSVLTPIAASGPPAGLYQFRSGVDNYPNKTSGINHNGNVYIQVNGTVRIPGDVIAGGDVEVYFSNSNSQLIITGELHAKSLKITNSTAGLLSVGEWSNDNFTTGSVENGDRSSIVVQNNITFERSANIRVAGDISANQINTASNYTLSVKTGGSIVTASNFASGLATNWTIGGSIATGGTFSFSNDVTNISINGSIYADQGISFDNPINGFDVGGSILSGKNLYMNNTTDDLNVNGDIRVKENINFNNSTNNVTLNGSIVSGGNTTYRSQMNNFSVAGNFLAGGSIEAYLKMVPRDINVVGLFGASGSINFGNGIQGVNEVGGIYTGDRVVVPDYYQWNGNGDCAIMVKHNPPPAGGTGSSGPKLVFGSWRS